MKLGFIGIVTQDMTVSLTFYRTLVVEIPDRLDDAGTVAGTKQAAAPRLTPADSLVRHGELLLSKQAFRFDCATWADAAQNLHHC